jgi:leucyl aminopeptidase
MKIDIGAKKGVVVLPVYNDKDNVHFFNDKNKELKSKVKNELKSFHYDGKKETGLFLKIGNEKVLLIGLNRKYTAEELRRAYSIVYKTLRARKEQDAFVEVPEEKEKEVKAVIEGFDLSDYKFDKYITEKEEKDLEISVSLDVSNKFSAVLKETLLIDNNVKIVRDLVNENTNEKTPQKLAEIVSNFAKKSNLKYEMLDEKAIQTKGLGLLWAVGKGSQYPPRLIVAEYKGDPKSKEIIALVGKGIVFDTGGTNLKPTGYIEDMKTDMAGAAACFGAFKTAVELKLKKNLILVIPTAENVLSGHSYKPGDFFTSYRGLTVEVDNTDAEGRLVLADAIAYVEENYKPTIIVDLATLTGACMVALGSNVAGLMGNNDELKKNLFKAGEETSERLWELPIYEDHRDAMKSKFADIKNSGSERYGGAMQGAAFLERFVQEGIQWAHLDIAGPARSKKESYYVPEFGTGKFVRLLVEFLQNN